MPEVTDDFGALAVEQCVCHTYTFFCFFNSSSMNFRMSSPPIGKAPPVCGLWAQAPAGRKVLGTHDDQTGCGRTAKERPA